MTETREARVRRILLAEWDPIGVRHIPEAADEYDAYVADLAAMVERGAPADELAAHLETLQTDWMGLPPRDEIDRGRIRAAAASLAALRS